MSARITRLNDYRINRKGHFMVEADTPEELEKALETLYAKFPKAGYGSWHEVKDNKGEGPCEAHFYHWGAD